MRLTYHSRSLYMMVKKTWRKRLTAFISTANRYSHASPDIMVVVSRWMNAQLNGSLRPVDDQEQCAPTARELGDTGIAWMM